MREIKFRAYDKRAKQMYQVKDLQLGEESWLKTATNYGKHPETGYNKFYPSEVELMQYTGLKDKNGKEIYEGDIVSEKGHFVNSDRLVYQKIQWKENYSCWLRGEYQRLTPKNIKIYDIKVIGNIYDNPELLEV